MPKEFLEERMEQMFNEAYAFKKSYLAKYLDIAKQAYYEKYNRNLSKWSEINIIRSLTNQERELAGIFGRDKVRKVITEATTTPNDVDKFIHYSFGFATAMLADNIIEKFSSVQTMDKKIGEVFYMDIIKGTSKGKYNVAGEPYIDALEGMKMPGGNYTSEFVEIEEFGEGDGVTTNFTTSLAFTPVAKNNLELYFTMGGNEYRVVDNGNGGFSHPSISASSIDYETGVVSVTFVNPLDNNSTLYASYKYISDIETGKVVDITVKLKNKFLTAGRRVANFKYLFDASLMLNKSHGIDLEAELIEKGVNGLMNEITIECINKIFKEAQDGTSYFNFSRTPPTGIPYIIHRQEIIGRIADGSLRIETDIRYAKPSVILCGREFSSLCRGLPNDVFQKADYDVTPVGPHVVGVLDGQYEVIQCLDILKGKNVVQDEFVLLAKGDDNLLTGCIFAEFIPLTVLNPIWTQSLDVFRSAVSYYAFKVINNKFFLKGKLVA